MSEPSELTWLAGANGLVGRALIRELSPRPVLALLRRPWPELPTRPGLQATVINYGDPAAFAALRPPRRLYIALGTTMAQAGSQVAFRAADFDAVIAVARSARAVGASHCAVVSALGADANSQVFYNRVKGEAEEALRALGFERLVIARPSLLDGDRDQLAQAKRTGEAWALRLSRPLAGLIPMRWRPIPAQRVAKAMVLALDQPGPAVQVLESSDLQRLGAP